MNYLDFTFKEWIKIAGLLTIALLLIFLSVAMIRLATDSYNTPCRIEWYQVQPIPTVTVLKGY